MLQIGMEEGLRNLLERYNYEYVQAQNNVVFLLGLHIDDADASFLDSEFFKARDEAMFEACVDNIIYITTALEHKLGFVPKNYFIDYEGCVINYAPNEEVSNVN